MLYNKKNDLPENNSTRQNTVRKFIHEFTAQEFQEIILEQHPQSVPIEELIAVGDAVFEFIRTSDIELQTKLAFDPLESQFNFYKFLVQRSQG
jgi:hypothetical protein